MLRRIVLPFLLTLTVLAGVSALFCHLSQTKAETVAPVGVRTVVIDAGHGGEDGGTVSADGTPEKDLNLDIAFRLRDLLTADGIPVVMTRTEDKLLYDPDADYRGRKKSLDLAARREIAENTENCLFVSIHMNSYPDPRYSGLQVWYSPNDPASGPLAAAVQSSARSLLQPDNDRKIKPATSSIYLLHRLRVPAVLVECGFLSNPEEAARLATPGYRAEVAFAVFLGLREAMGAGA